MPLRAMPWASDWASGLWGWKLVCTVVVYNIIFVVFIMTYHIIPCHVAYLYNHRFSCMYYCPLHFELDTTYLRKISTSNCYHLIGFQPLDVVAMSKIYRTARHRLIVLDWGGTLVVENDKVSNSHIHTHTHTYIYIYTHTHIYIYIYTHICIYVYIYIYAYTHSVSQPWVR